eukprot:m.1154414 g.1154414  ORF g.1154414 m.1154414 type:complete len:124 (+) comp24488_c0_seq30:125-496(+)
MHAYGSPSLNQNITPQDFDSAQYPTMVHLTVKSGYGAPARWMHESCAIGSKLFIRAGGSTVLQQDTADKPALFVAGGIGIAPLHGMLQERLYGTAPGIKVYGYKHRGLIHVCNPPHAEQTLHT